jgi:hypothetical protein
MSRKRHQSRQFCFDAIAPLQLDDEDACEFFCSGAIRLCRRVSSSRSFSSRRVSSTVRLSFVS